MEKIILPYLNVLEVDEINRANATKVIAIDKDNEIKTLTIDNYTATGSTAPTLLLQNNFNWIGNFSKV